MLDEINLFLDIVRLKNLTKVAALHQLSKSQVSRRLTQLEQSLQTKLIQRSTRHISLTPSGFYLHQAFMQMKSLYLEALEQIHQQDTSLEGLIKITAPTTWGSDIICPLLAKFSAAHPGIQLKIDLSPAIRDLYFDDFDVAIRAGTSLPDTDLKARKLVSYPFVVCASAHYLSQHPQLKHPQDLSTHPCINDLTDNPEYKKYRWSFSKDGAVINVETTRSFEVSNYQAQKQLLLEGMGVAKLPLPFIESELKQKQILPLFSQYSLAPIHLWILYPRNAFLPKKLRALIDFLSAKL